MQEIVQNQNFNNENNDGFDMPNLAGFFAFAIGLDKKQNPHLYHEGKLKEEINKENNGRHSYTNNTKILGKKL